MASVGPVGIDEEGGMSDHITMVNCLLFTAACAAALLVIAWMIRPR